MKWNSDSWGIFWINPPDGRGHGLKIIESKNRHHFEKPTFLVLQLWTSSLFWFGHFKCLKNAPCLWFGRFSSHVKRCRSACNVSYRSWEKTKCLFPPSGLTNNFWLKGKVVHLKKLVFQSGVGFLIRCVFDDGQFPLVDFWRIWSGNFLFFWQFGILIPW